MCTEHRSVIYAGLPTNHRVMNHHQNKYGNAVIHATSFTMSYITTTNNYGNAATKPSPSPCHEKLPKKYVNFNDFYLYIL